MASRIGLQFRGFALPIPAITCALGDPARFSPPPHLFLSFCCKQKTSAIRRLGLPCVTLGWPLGHAWVTQGSPNPRPNPKPNRQRVALRSRAAQNRGPRQARCWLGGVEIRRTSNCHRERAAKPGPPASAIFACWGEAAGSRTIQNGEAFPSHLLITLLDFQRSCAPWRSLTLAQFITVITRELVHSQRTCLLRPSA
jgi:hypothetical protein